MIALDTDTRDPIEIARTDTVRGPRPAPLVRTVTPYAPGIQLRPIDLRLDANEGPTPSGVLIEWLRADAPELLRRYPSAAALESQIATRVGVETERVVVTAGGADALERIVRAVLAPGREAVLVTPAFEMLSKYVQLSGGEVIEAPWLDERLDVDAIESRVGPRTAMIFVATPNSVTGRAISADAIRRLAAAIPAGILVVDLACTEYADEDLTEVVLSLPNAVAVRTFSKAWGLAGLRVGYAIGPAEVIGWLRTVGHPYAVSGPSLAIASAWYDAGRSRVDASVRRVRLERRELAAHLRELRAEPIESQANFVLARFDTVRGGAPIVADMLAGLGIAVRRFTRGSLLESYLRITVPGEASAFNRLCEALTAVLRPRLVLFALEGVLTDVLRSSHEAIIRTAGDFGARVTSTDIRALKSGGNASNDWLVTQRLLRTRGIEIPLEEVIRTFESFYQGDEITGLPGLWRYESLLIDVADLRLLGTRYKLGIVTGRPRRDAERLLASFGIADLFEIVITMEDAPPKPDPRPVLRALERSGEAAAWMICDTPDDVRAARSARAVPIAVVMADDAVASDSAGQAAMTRAGAARVLSRVTELAEILS